MNTRYVPIVAALLISSSSSIFASDELAGVWQTQRSDSGGYLLVEFDECDQAMCGVIIAAYNDQDEQGHAYEHLGKNMVWDMRVKGEGRWAGGNIWDPEKDKTYRSKMSLEGAALRVSGCIAFFCRSQLWTKVK